MSYFHFFDTRIAAIGKVIGPVETAPKPDFGTAGGNWADEGWLVPTEFVGLSNQVRPKDHIATLREYLPSLYSPLNSVGNGSQSVYLTAVPEPLAEQLGKLIGPEFAKVLGELGDDIDGGAQDDEAEKAIRGRTDIPATHKI
jgi:putative restriction endonuclease